MEKCPYCGMFHDSVCSRVKCITYYEDGPVKSVEFHAPLPQLELDLRNTISAIEPIAVAAIQNAVRRNPQMLKQ